MIYLVNSFRFYFVWVLFLLLVPWVNLVSAERTSTFAPTHFVDVHFPEISPDEQKRLDETFQTFNDGTENQTEKFETLRSFLLLKPGYFTLKNQTFQDEFLQEQIPFNIFWSDENSNQFFCKKTVSEEIRSFLWSLPKETKLAWQQFADEYIEQILNSEFASHRISSHVRLRQILEETPFSSYEVEILELLAQFEWMMGQKTQANTYWQMEFQLRSNQNDEGWKKFFLNELPPLEILRNRITNTQELIKSNKKSVPQANENLPINWRITMTQIVSPTGEIVFEDELPEEQRGTLFPSRERNVQAENQEIPELSAISPDRKFLAARLGTQVTLWSKEEHETRPQSYLVVLDLTRGAQLLWTAQPVSSQVVFIGNPLVDVENLYIPVLQNGSPAQVSLEIYSLMDGLLKQRIPLFWVDISKFQEYSTIFLPIRWTNEGNLQVGGFESGIQMIMTPTKFKSY